MAQAYDLTLDTSVFIYHIEIGRLRLTSHCERFVGADERLENCWSVGVTKKGNMRRWAFGEFEQDKLV